MTLPKAKDLAATKAGYKDWTGVILADMTDKITTLDKDELSDKAAELYAASIRDEGASIMKAFEECYGYTNDGWYFGSPLYFRVEKFIKPPETDGF